MKLLIFAFSIIHGCMAALFACAALMLIAIATKEAWTAFAGGLNHAAAQQIIEAIGLLAAAVVALQIAQTITEEEVVRDAHISGPTRVRRFLSSVWPKTSFESANFVGWAQDVPNRCC